MLALSTIEASAQRLTLQDVAQLTLQHNFDIQIAKHVEEIGAISNDRYPVRPDFGCRGENQPDWSA